MRLTPEQAEAIAARGQNLMLAAAAGSGKTTVLVERVLSLIMDGANIDEMLIVTFTRAAAADMKRKLTEKLAKIAESDPRMLEQLARIDYAPCSTIHAFCIDVLRDHFERANVDASFAVEDNALGAQLAARALQDALEDAYAKNEPGLGALDFGRGADAIGEIILRLSNFLDARPDPERWLEEALIALPARDGGVWRDELLNNVRQRLTGALELPRAGIVLCEGALGPTPYIATLDTDLRLAQSLLAQDDEDLAAQACDAALAPLNRYVIKKTDPDCDARARLRDQVKELRNSFKDVFAECVECCRAAADTMADLHGDKDMYRALFDLVLSYRARLAARRRDKSVLSFSDLEHAAMRVLADESVANAYRERFTHIFVDEYQDVSDMQEAILSRVARRDNLFVVGDVNQSIYRFRLAEPRLFIDKYDRFARNDGGRLIALNRNFRSRATILRFVNDVFTRAMSKPYSEFAYDENARMRAGSAFPDADAPVEIALLTDDADEDELSGAQREAAWVARRIRELVGTAFYDGKRQETRPIAYRDIVILARSRTAFSAFRRELQQNAIPCYADQAQGYWDALEIKTALALFRVIENRRRDTQLLGVLRSPVARFTTSELARLRAAHPQGSIRDAMLAEIAENGALAGKLGALEALLNRLRVLSRALPLADFGDRALDESGLYAHASALPGGETRLLNLQLLLSHMADFEATQAGGLTGFLAYAAEIRERGGDSGEAHTLGEHDDVVRLMTVHKSKGLEFPIVFAVRLGQRFGGGAGRDELRVHRALGVGLKHFDGTLHTVRETISRRAIELAKAREDLNEELRVLYVCLTRAQYRLLLVGCAGATREKADMRFQLAAQSALAPRNYLDVLMPAALDSADARVLYPQSVSHAEARAEDNEPESAPDPQRVRALTQALLWRYPYEGEAFQPVKLTATGLTRALVSPAIAQPITQRPRFLSDAPTAAEKGVQMHAALSAIDLDALRGKTDRALADAVSQSCASLRARGVLTGDVSESLLTAFFESALGQRLLLSEEVRREWPFVLRMTMREALGNDLDAPILVQGVIDLCFREGDEWVLIDFKTDFDPDDERIIALYAQQLSVYRAALSRITETNVKQALLVLVTQKRWIDLTEKT